MSIRDDFLASPYESRKHTSYFETYEALFSHYRGLPMTFVEVGVLNGGSLFMWRSYFGDSARIIGVDMNPTAKRWEQHGFEIRIGNQANPEFWRNFFGEIGSIDVLLDDGGHTFEQQIITCRSALPWVRDGGILAVEDTHTSYMADFGGPSKRSFMSFAKNIVDGINYRSGKLSSPIYEKEIASVCFHESIVAFHVDRTLASTKSSGIVNKGITLSEDDFRRADVGESFPLLKRLYHRGRELPAFGMLMEALWHRVRPQVYRFVDWKRSRRLKSFFHY